MVREYDLPKGHTENIDKTYFQKEILALVKSNAKLTETMGSHPRLLSWLDAAEGVLR